MGGGDVFSEMDELVESTAAALHAAQEPRICSVSLQVVEQAVFPLKFSQANLQKDGPLNRFPSEQFPKVKQVR